jgi:hypothetical protein
MTQEKSRPQDQEAAAVANDPTLNKEAVDEVVGQYEESAKSDETTELSPATQKELGDVERALEDSLLGIEDAS